VVAAAGVLVLVLIGGVTILAFTTLPAPTQKVEKILPDAQFPA
jgi:hypothetical protein